MSKSGNTEEIRKSGALPFCIPVKWQDSQSREHWLAYPHLTFAQGYHCVNTSAGRLADDFNATVDDFGNLVPVGRPYPAWIDTIGQMGHVGGAR